MTDGNGVLRYQVEQQGRRLDALEEWRRAMDTEVTTLKANVFRIRDDVHDITTKDVPALSNKLDGVHRRLSQFAFTVAGSTLVFALSVLVATGKL